MVTNTTVDHGEPYLNNNQTNNKQTYIYHRSESSSATACEYVRCEPIYSYMDMDLDGIEYFSEDSKGINVKDFFYELDNFSYDRFEANKRNGKQYILCYQIDILMPEDLPLEKYYEMPIKFMKDFAFELPYAFYCYQQGKGKYIRIYVSERYYYPNGREVIKYLDHDIYTNVKNGRLCKKDDPNAKLSKAKGSVIRTETIYFSDKIRTFMVSDEARSALHLQMISIASDILNELRCFSKKIFKIKKIDRRKAHNRFQNRNITYINNTITEIQTILNNFGTDLRTFYFWDEYADRFWKIVHKAQSYFSQGFMKTGKVKMFISMNTNWQRLDENLNSIKVTISDMVTDIQTEIHNSVMQYYIV